MKVLGIRFCTVCKGAEALARFLGDGLGLQQREMVDAKSDDFAGSVFRAGDSFVEVWPEGPGMPAGTMLQIVVDDADAFAERARSKGLHPHGPTDAHGERMYYLQAPNGLPVSLRSQLKGDSK